MLRPKKTTCALVQKQNFHSEQFWPKTDFVRVFVLLAGIPRSHQNIVQIKFVQNENLYSKNLSAGSYKVISQHQRGPKSEKICPNMVQTCCFLPNCQNPSIPVKSLPNKSRSYSKNTCYKPLFKVIQAHNSTSEGCKVEKDLPRYCSSTRFFAFLSESVDTCEKLTY